jgi:Dolichyl-phosphate-mannose-protein mannosyltransferase
MRLAAVLAALTLIRLVLAAFIPLVPDETYYWAWSHALAPGYFDHPGMVAVWIRIGTAIAGDTALGVRLLAPLAMGLASWMLWDAAERLFPGRGTGLWAVLLYNCTLLAAGTSILQTPDAPLMLFWTAALWAAARLAAGGSAAWWLVAGASAGAAMASKYTAVLLPAGMLLWLLWVPALRVRLRRPWPWLGALLALAVFLPVLAWNADHGWISFRRQGGRLDDWAAGQAVRFIPELIAGQLGLTSLLAGVLFAAGMGAALRHAVRERAAGWTLLAALSVPACLLFLQHATGDRVQGNWPAIIWPAAAIAAAGIDGRLVRRLRGPAVAFGFCLGTVLSLHAASNWPALPGRLDPTARLMGGWQALSRQLLDEATAHQAAFIAIPKYSSATAIAWFLPPGIPAIGVADRWPFTSLPRPDIAGRTGLWMAQPADDPDPLHQWASIRPLGEVSRMANGEAVETLRLYLVTAATTPDEAVLLPMR